MRYLLILLLVVLTGSPARAAIIFDTDFEACSVGTSDDFPCEGWDDFNTANPGHLGVTTSLYFSGSKSVKGTFDNINGSTQQPSIYKSVSPKLDHVFIRFAYRTSPGFQIGSNGHTKIMFLKDDVGYPNIWIGNVNGKYDMDIQNPYGSTSTVIALNSGVAPSSTAWDQVEVEWQLNTPGQANGLLRMWINGVLRIEQLNFEYRGPTPSSTKPSNGASTPSTLQFRTAQVYIQSGVGDVYFDRIAVGDTRVGLATAAPPDTSPPTQPNGLVLTASGANVSLAWNPSSDNIGVTNYAIFRCLGNACTPSTALVTVGNTPTSYIDSTVIAGSIYNYAIKAVDLAGNLSVISSSSQITAPTIFPRTLYTDNFNRANTTTTLGASWDAGVYTSRTNLGITSNALRTITTATVSLQSFSSTGAIGDQWAQATFTSLPTVSNAHVIVTARQANAATESYYGCRLQADTPRVIMEKRTAGVGANLQATALYDAVWVAGDKMRIEVTGAAPATIKCYRVAVNGTETLLLTDSSDSAFATGKAGIRMSSVTAVTSPELDDFAVGDFQSAVATTAPTFDAVSSSATGNTTSSITWTHTVGSGTNRLLAVCLAARDATTAGDVLASTVTANGLAMTKAKEQTQRVDDYFAVSLWYLINPGVGTNTIVATWGGAPSAYGVGSGISLAGVDQITPIDATSGAGGVNATASTTTTTVANHAMIVDCAALRANPVVSIGGSQTSRVSRLTTGVVDAVGISTVNDKTPAGAQNTTWTQNASSDYALAAMSLTPASVTPVVEPTIIGLIVDPANTGVDLTYGPTTPSSVRFQVFTNSGVLSPFTFTVSIASIIAGRYNTVFPAGYDGVCAFAINAVGIENFSQSAFYRCASLVGIVPAVDTTPATLTTVLPSGTLNQGTTSTAFVVSSNKVVSMKWDTVNTTYDLMANFMSCVSLTCSASTGAILSNGTTTHVYVRSQFTNAIFSDIVNSSSLDVPITVSNSAPTDTIAPTAPSDLTFERLSQAQVKLTWTASTDAVGVTGYQVYADQSGTCSGLLPVGNVVALTQTVENLVPNSSVSFTLKALDAAGNMSAASSCVTVTTSPITDVSPPTTMQNFIGTPNAQSVLLTWDPMTDNISAVIAIIERCQGAGCTNFAVVSSELGNSITIGSLSPGTTYRFRGIGSDGTNVSVAYSPIIDVVTLGLCGP